MFLPFQSLLRMHKTLSPWVEGGVEVDPTLTSYSECTLAFHSRANGRELNEKASDTSDAGVSLTRERMRGLVHRPQ